MPEHTYELFTVWLLLPEREPVDKGTTARCTASESTMAWNIVKVSSASLCFLVLPPQNAWEEGDTTSLGLTTSRFRHRAPTCCCWSVAETLCKFLSSMTPHAPEICSGISAEEVVEPGSNGLPMPRLLFLESVEQT